MAKKKEAPKKASPKKAPKAAVKKAAPKKAAPKAAPPPVVEPVVEEVVPDLSVESVCLRAEANAFAGQVAEFQGQSESMVADYRALANNADIQSVNALNVDVIIEMRERVAKASEKLGKLINIV